MWPLSPCSGRRPRTAAAFHSTSDVATVSLLRQTLHRAVAASTPEWCGSCHLICVMLCRVEPCRACPCYTVPPRGVRRVMPRANYAANLIAELVRREREREKKTLTTSFTFTGPFRLTSVVALLGSVLSMNHLIPGCRPVLAPDTCKAAIPASSMTPA